MTPATAVRCEHAAGDRQRADGGDEAGGDGLGVGDAAVDEDDEVAVLAAGQPVLAAQGAGEAGGERAQEVDLGVRGEDLGGEPVDADEGQGVRAAGCLALHGAQRRTRAARLGRPVTGSVRESSSQFGVDARRGDAGGDVAAVQDERADVGVGAQVADGGLDQQPAAVGMPHPGGADGELVASAGGVAGRAKQGRRGRRDGRRR